MSEAWPVSAFVLRPPLVSQQTNSGRRCGATTFSQLTSWLAGWLVGGWGATTGY